ncbi:MAG TPA: hypothetical protein VIL74_06725 [Pyrinomonadaceae bacterium]|jgi:hypothetical protein
MKFQQKISRPFLCFAVLKPRSLMPVLFAVRAIAAQTPAPDSALLPQDDYTWWYVGFFAALALAGAAVWALKAGKAAKNDAIARDYATIAADFETERRRSGQPVEDSDKKSLADNLPKTAQIFNRAAESTASNFAQTADVEEEAPRSPQKRQLPVFEIEKLERAGKYSPLPISNDEDLLCAIEQALDEFEDDVEIRELAVRVLARFKTRNSVEALSGAALYDLSSQLRSKALAILADFDHESVFEPILLACADPSREVRAAAARAFFRLNFDRADAWARIGETGDEFRMRQAAHAAREAELVRRSIDRLVHEDRKIAYEAVTLLALLIRAGETEELFQTLENHQNRQVKLALVHVIGLTNDAATIAKLDEIAEKSDSFEELRNKIDEVKRGFKLIPA